SSHVDIYSNNGNGTAFTVTTVANLANVGAIAVGQFNNDTNLDFVAAVTGPGNNLLVGFGNGAGGISGTMPLASGARRSLNNSVIVGDFNNDGLSDIATANSIPGNPETLSVLLRSGSTFAAQPLVTLSSTTGTQVVNIAAADFDGDGLLDIASTTMN